VLGQNRGGVGEVLEQALVEDDVEGAVGERQREGVALNEMAARGSTVGLANRGERAGGVVERRHGGAGLGEAQRVAAAAGPHLEDTAAGNGALTQDLRVHFADRLVDLLDGPGTPESILPLAA